MDTMADRRSSVHSLETLRDAENQVQHVQMETLEFPYAHLPPHQAQILEQQVTTADIKKGAGILYRYASRNDILILFISSATAIGAGAAFPLMTIVFGKLQGVFENYLTGATDYGQFKHEMDHYVLYFIYLAIGEFFATYICTVGFIYAGEHISGKIRAKYLESCVYQNIGFFDKTSAGEVTTRITSDTNLIQDGISEKMSLTISALATFFVAFIIGYVYYWKLTLILTGTIFALMINSIIGSGFMGKNSKQAIDSYAVGGSLADEVFSSVRNAIAFGTQNRLANQYGKHLDKAEYFGIRYKAALAFMVAGMMLITYLNYGLAFWQGSKFLIEGVVPLSKVLTIMMCVMIGSFQLGNVAPNLQAFGTAVAASVNIFTTIDRVSPINSSSKEGDILAHVEGNIRLENVQHIYPSRPDVLVMQDMTLDIPAGKTTALVGASGSGKSTIIGLVERFYNPVEGKIYLDGHDITSLNLRWLRQQMALVSQEPTLFSTTIFENISNGLTGLEARNLSKEAKKELVVNAARMANAHDFIVNLPDGYETEVGEGGFLLSGGQKQRIVIARAVISDPKILLLDEATSALDTRSEGIVQKALEAASQGRTTITVAHRLSTIKDADNIVVMAEGRIVEQGTHYELLDKKGSYASLVSAQNIAASTDGDQTDDDDDDGSSEHVKYLKHQLSSSLDSDFTDIIAQNPDDIVLKRISTAKTTGSRRWAEGDTKGALKEEDTHYSLWTLMKLLAKYNRQEWKLMLLGFIFSIICGSGNPVASVFFSKEIGVLSVVITPSNSHEVKHHSDFWSVMYVMLAFVQFLAFGAQGYLFARCSEKLINRVRDEAFRTIIRQDVEFFDRDENTAGALTSFLSTETTNLAGLSGSTLGTVLMLIATLAVSTVVSLAIGWKLTLVCLPTVPLLVGCGFYRFWMLAKFELRSKKAYGDSASYASEAISAIRTVAALTREQQVLDQYINSLEAQQRRSLLAVSKSSILYATSHSLIFLCFALGFWYGGTLIGRHEYDIFQFFVCFMCILFGAQSAGTVFSQAPSMGKAYHAARQLMQLIDRTPKIDTWSDKGQRLEKVEGTVEFRDVHFRYPTRPDQPVLRGLNLTVKPGQYVALVGSSGCGKSTTIALLERFYDALKGGVYVDDINLNTLNVNDYRSYIALVSQEPTLYQGTIRENIEMGSPLETVPEATIERVCREANIWDFITSLPQGLSTVVGSKGALLSGGQKQRVAIARALVRDPKILLLDEATSALDSESEHIVQEALDIAAQGRTTIAVAHRLSTIQKADIVYVFDQGQVAEYGSHAELMKRNGIYTEMVRLQNLSQEAK